MNTVFPFSSNPSLASSNISEEIFPPPTQVKKRRKVARAAVKEKKVLTRSMERLVLGLQILFIVMYALFVRYDSEQGDSLQSTKIQKTRFSQLFPDGVGTPAVISEGVVPLAPNYVEYYGYPPPFARSTVEDTDTRSVLREWLKEQETRSKQTLLRYDSLYMDVHVMIFIGFGFLMTFLKKYGYSAVGLTMLLAAIAIQWAILCRGIFNHDEHGIINIEITTLINADFAAGAVLISLGAILGVTSPFQLMVMVLIEVFFYSLNEYIGTEVFKAIDVGGSMFIHAFGAYFGLALSRMLKPMKDINTTNEGATKTSDLFAMIGTIFLWIYWPSFNGALASGDDQHRAVLNTLLSLTASLLMTFVWSGILSHENKLDMVHIQNATLAGGVAIGAVADLMVRPFGSLIIGSIAGTVSTFGYVYLTPFLADKLNLHDTCGVHNLHGMPGVIGGIAGTIMAAIASEETYGNSLYEQYKARAPLQNSSELSDLVNENTHIEAGDNRSATAQALYQLAALGCTIGIAFIGGSLTGLLLRAPVFDNVPDEHHFDDLYFWEVPEDDEKKKLLEGGGVINRNFDSNGPEVADAEIEMDQKI